MTTSVRPATPDDARAVAEVHVEGWRVGYRGLLPDAHLDALDVEEKVVDWARALTDGADVLVADDDDEVLGSRVLGFVTLGPTRDTDLPAATGEVMALYVRTDRWGRGVGGTLLGAALERLREDGAHQAALWTLEGAAPTRRFYAGQGWRADGAVKVVELPGLLLPEVRYRFP